MYSDITICNAYLSSPTWHSKALCSPAHWSPAKRRRGFVVLRARCGNWVGPSIKAWYPLVMTKV